ncbi:DUF3617 family protein [Bosea sp. (in: a-proteobacteria)]|uniref:DUF3617 domain-containing protein n=1 Tax=Bosea sp. (in: a-proteobacteria) TaxID=1871050 RepID=UPI0033427CCB
MRPEALAVTVLAMAVPALAEDLPQRRPGLWETRSQGEQGEVVAKQCLGPDTERSLAGSLAGGTCSKLLVTRTATGYAIETECAMGPIKASGSSVVTGDFENAIRSEGATRLTGMPGQSAPLERRLVVESRRLGDCGPGQKPGDVVAPDGQGPAKP